MAETVWGYAFGEVGFRFIIYVNPIPYQSYHKLYPSPISGSNFNQCHQLSKLFDQNHETLPTSRYVQQRTMCHLYKIYIP